MFERFTDGARAVVVGAQEHARRFGHGFIGCEHLLLAAVSTSEPASAALREHGVTPEAVEKEIIRFIGAGPGGGLFSALDREALASIGIDFDAVRARIEAAFGPDALSRDRPFACRRRRGPTWGRGPVARLLRHRRRRHARMVPAPPGGPVRTGHIPFTPRAKKSLEHSLREAKLLNDNYIGVQHLVLALIAMNDGAVPPILAALGASRAALRTAVLNRYRQAS
jgi:ATP-dependent Clp protease ATP-binding subunit ClpA